MLSRVEENGLGQGRSHEDSHRSAVAAADAGMTPTGCTDPASREFAASAAAAAGGVVDSLAAAVDGPAGSSIVLIIITSHMHHIRHLSPRARDGRREATLAPTPSHSTALSSRLNRCCSGLSAANWQCGNVAGNLAWSPAEGVAGDVQRCVYAVCERPIVLVVHTRR